jgi:hypothetical protein
MRAEFKRIGETQLRDALNSRGGVADEPKGQAAFRWLGDEAQSAAGPGGQHIPLCPLDLLRRYRRRGRPHRGVLDAFVFKRRRASSLAKLLVAERRPDYSSKLAIPSA